MDKETLSNYGWIVICVLVMVVMIALAGPFGNFVADAVKSTTQGLFDTNKNAMNAAGIEIDVEVPLFSNPALNPNDGTTPADGDTYVSTDANFDDYTYTYLDSRNGWQLAVNDKTKTSYDAILESINGVPVTSLASAFSGCSNLTTAPVIPSTVTSMYQAFKDCTSLKTYVGSTGADGDFSGYKLPKNLTSMYVAFEDCDLMTIAPKVPNTVTNMEYAFFSCDNLSVAPAIPESVTNIKSTFRDCNSLTGAITINTNTTSYANCFKGVDMTNITLTGSASKDVLNAIGATGSNWTPIE